MGRIKEEAWVEKCTVLHEGKATPNIYYNVFADVKQLCKISYDRLIAIRNLIKRKENAMNKEKALALVDVLLSEGTSPIEKERAAMQLRELIRILLPE